MPSARFSDLTKRISELKRHLLPRKFDPTGSYSDAVYERARAFRVLAHAEFEAYIEDRAAEVVNRAFDVWKDAGKLAPCLLSLVAYKDSLHPVPGSLSDSSNKHKFHNLTGVVDAARNEFNKYLRRQNHGIKEKNILRILIPIGIKIEEINSSWLVTTDTWAASRGDAAHKSAKLQVKLDPQHELKTVMEILEGFEEMDQKIANL
ncbi:HEPN domain-containing protein [Amycolatopsis sp. CA-126428]|uniref:HEPN domain-containing protein n=1 Tax=Amycolatopsis sp. CA-126428 TaxID=2073158 RepID=UPI0011AFECEC|nr:HEPN domain-containing protein [Amycolatopsis sp. CA-126428]